MTICRRKPLRLASCLALAAAAALGSPGSAELIPYTGHQKQLTLALPAGWTAYDQARAFTGRPSAGGLLIFSEFDFSAFETTDEQLEAMVQLDTGQAPCFFVDRLSAPRGASCGRLTEKAQRRIRGIVEAQPVLAKDRTVVEPLEVRTETVAGCAALHFTARTRKADGKEWALDARAVSDGRTLYLFFVRAHAEHLGANLGHLEASLETLQLTNAR